MGVETALNPPWIGRCNGLSGQAIRVVVPGNTIRSATIVATGDTIPVPNPGLSTSNDLFDRAIAARDAGGQACACFL